METDNKQAYGVRIIFTVAGTAGKFSIVPLLITFGSGIGLLSLATLVADLLVTKVLKKRDYYEAHMYEDVETPELISNPSEKDPLLVQST